MTITENIKIAYDFLIIEANRSILTLIGIFIAAIIGGAWKVYTHFFPKIDRENEVKNSNQGVVATHDFSAIANGGNGLAINNTGVLNINQKTDYQNHKLKLAEFLIEAQQLSTRTDENPLPVMMHNNWVDKVDEYLSNNLDLTYKVRFNDFSGIVFYGDGSDKSKMEISIKGRKQRLNEFMSELSR